MFFLKSTLFISSLFLLVINVSTAQSLKYDRHYFKAFPKYRQVVESYYTAHPSALKQTLYYYVFEKRPKGWFVVKKSFTEPDAVIERTIIWDAKKRTYTFEKGTPTFIAQKMYAGNAIDFYLAPVYGYDEAAQDIIDLLSQFSIHQLEAEELEAMARAYEELAYAKLGRKYHSQLEKFDKTLDPKDIDPKIIAQAKKDAKASLKLYQRLAQKHPTHTSLVGDMRQKLANSYMYHYIQFKAMRQEKTANEFLKSAKYDAKFLSYCKNILTSCPPNSILFTYSDNDSYPLWYLQAKKGYRKDICIINVPLLAVGRFIHFYTTNMVTMQYPKLSLDFDQQYKSEYNDVCIIDELAKANAKDFLELMNKDEAPKSYNDNYIHFPATIYLSTGLELKYTARYLIKNDLAMLDLIESNWTDRPICFINQQQGATYVALKPYRRSHGVVEVLKKTKEFVNYIPAKIDYDQTISLLKKYQYPKAYSHDAFLQKLTPFLVILQYTYMNCIEEAMNRGDSTTAKALLKTVTNTDVLKQIKASLSSIQFADFAYRLGLPKLRDYYIQNYVDVLEKELEELNTPKQTALALYLLPNTEKNIHLNIGSLINYCRLKDWDEWVRSIQKKFNH